MGKVTTVTFSYTIFHAIFYLLCRGWSITSQQVDRNQATNLTMVMGLVYLLYSAHFLSSDFPGMDQFVDYLLCLVYFLFGFYNLKSLHKQRKIVKQYIMHQDDGDLPNNQAFQNCVKLKYRILTRFNYVMIVFFCSKTFLYFFKGMYN